VLVARTAYLLHLRSRAHRFKFPPGFLCSSPQLSHRTEDEKTPGAEDSNYEHWHIIHEIIILLQSCLCVQIINPPNSLLRAFFEHFILKLNSLLDTDQFNLVGATFERLHSTIIPLSLTWSGPIFLAISHIFFGPNRLADLI
jgi:hypothetical protein